MESEAQATRVEEVHLKVQEAEHWRKEQEALDRLPMELFYHSKAALKIADRSTAIAADASRLVREAVDVATGLRRTVSQVVPSGRSVIARHEIDEHVCKLQKLSHASQHFKPEMNANHHTIGDQTRHLDALEWQLLRARRKVHAKMEAQMDEGEICE